MDPDASGGWRFAQCFGDKGDVEDITEGNETSLSVWSGRRASHQFNPRTLDPRANPRSIFRAITLTLSNSGQPISFLPSSLTLPETTLRRVTRAVAWCYSSEMTWCALPSPPLWAILLTFADFML